MTMEPVNLGGDEYSSVGCIQKKDNDLLDLL